MKISVVFLFYSQATKRLFFIFQHELPLKIQFLQIENIMIFIVLQLTSFSFQKIFHIRKYCYPISSHSLAAYFIAILVNEKREAMLSWSYTDVFNIYIANLLP